MDIQALRKQLAAAEQAMAAADRTARKAQSEAWEAITSNPDSWEWLITYDAYHAFMGETFQGARVSKRIYPHLLAAWLKNGPSTFSSDFQEEGRWFGMFYYRTDEGILTYEGGGYRVLRTPKLCNDDEWQAILDGNIPAKFIL